MTDSRDRHRERVHDERAGQRCPGCGRSLDTADRVDVHHHDQNSSNGHPANLRKRCKRCHLEGEHDRPDDVDPKGPAGLSRRGPQGISRSGPPR
ncbi:HNH endonuclease [Natronorubrum halophilum]|uniref:HNH endonuclease n=1 Tax=Natronorubrum halophilum TaxID=1702106 RepID=UPI0010C1A41D|nr:HNH endonuclease [Natronorubrum halophilum]